MGSIGEVLVPINRKDYWNFTDPDEENEFKASELRPLLADYIHALFGVDVPPNDADRADIEAALFRGVPGLTAIPNAPYADLLRLNTGVPPTPFRSANALGVIAGDNAGFPNGRRICDDVVDIEIRVVAGGTVLTPAFNHPPNNQLGDGVDFPYRGCRLDFPYIWSPSSGFDAKHTPFQEPIHAASAPRTFRAEMSDAEVQALILRSGGEKGRNSPK